MGDTRRPAAAGPSREAATTARCSTSATWTAFRRPTPSIAASSVNFRLLVPYPFLRILAGMVSTLGEAHDLGWRLTVFCRASRREGLKSIRGCVGRHQADLLTMLWTHGRDNPITWLDGRLKCPRCGSRQVLVAFEPPGVPAAGRTSA